MSIAVTPVPTEAVPARRPTRRSAREQEIDHAHAAVAAGHGAVVWTGETGVGATVTLEIILDHLARRPTHPVPLIVRCHALADAEGSGGFLRHVERQIAALTGRPPGGDATDGSEVVAARLTDALVAAAGPAPVVLALDGLHLLDLPSADALWHLLTQRRIRVVLLATAPEGAGLPPLPHPVELRTVPPLGPEDAVTLLRENQRLTVAPHVVAQLAHQLGGNATALLQTARLLTAEQLAGAAVLPDPLPAAPVLRTLLGARLDALDPDERRALLVAAVAVVDRTDVLLAATGRDIEALLQGPLAEHLTLAGGRFAFADRRMRALVHGEARLAERTAAHAALAEVHGATGEEDLAVWHTTLANLEGRADLADGLLAFADRLLARGDAVGAYEVAREAASQADPGTRPRACALAGTAALESGHVQDAADWLRSAARSGDEGLRATTLAPLVAALTFAEGQVPDDVVEPYLAAATTGELPGEHLTAVLAGVLTAARLHAERSDGAKAGRLYEAARRLGSDHPDSADDLALAALWLAVHGVAVSDALGEPTGASTGDAALTAVARTLIAVQADDYEGAAQTIASAIARLAPVAEEASWRGGTDVAVTPVVEAHLRLAQVLVDVWRGDLARAVDDLAVAAHRVPIHLPMSGLGVVAARRLDLLTRGVVGPVATALEEVCVDPTAAVVRRGLLVDRALAAFFAGQTTQAATLLSLAEERDRPRTARSLGLPGLDVVETWMRAGRPDAAGRSANETVQEALDLPPRLRAARTGRIRVAVCSPERLDVEASTALAAVRELGTPFEHARTALGIGEAYLRAGRPGVAQPHLLSAAELFDEAGAHAWTEVAARDLAAAEAMAAGDPAEDRPAPVARGDDAAAGVPRRWASVLTARELDVALAVVRGGANRDVAEQLFLSVRTVEVHLGRVFRKLGVRSRLELTVLAHRSDD